MFHPPFRLIQFSFTKAKRGSELLVTTILLHVCSAMTDNEAQRVTIVDDFPIETTTFKIGSGTRSFSGTVDHLLVRVRPGQFSGKAHLFLSCKFLTSVF
jgi:hypothetical protein